MNVLLLILGGGVVVVGVLSVMRPGRVIGFRNEWSRLVTRPFLRGRVLGGEARRDDPLQLLITRASGILFLVVGIGLLIAGVMGSD